MNSSSLILAVLSLVAILHNHQAHALVHFCSNVQELRDAMATVLPGDHIVLAEGTTFKATDVAGQDIGAHYSSNVDGTPTDRITIRSENPDNRATLSGDKVGHLHVLRLFGNNWTIRDLIFTHAQKGIVLDHANNVHIVGCEVYYIGMEAIHIRDGSKNTLIEDCFIHDTGESTAAYGEAIYVGSDKGVWGKYNPDVSGTIVRGCTIGPNVGAEAFDVKEGTSETIIEHNVVDATGLSGQGYADSFIDLKGTRTYVRYNVFYRNNADKLAKAIAIVKRPLPWGDMSTYEHVIHDNIFHLDDSGIDVVHAYSGFRDIYAFNNLPADGPIADGIYTTCCPPWYTPPSNNTLVCLPPVGHFSAFVTNTSVRLSWTGFAAYFTVSYKKIGSSLVEEVSTSSNLLVLDGLEYNATYEWKVQSNCASSESEFTVTDIFTTGQPDDGPPPYSDGSVVIYDDDLGDFWNDYSFGATVNFADTSDTMYGSQAIKCSYGSYGGLYLKRSQSLGARNVTYFRFWAKGDTTINCAGDVGLRLKVNNEQLDITIVMNDVWQNYQFSLEDFKNPNSIDSIVIQNDSGENRLVFFDQIELVQDEVTGTPTVSPTSPSQPPNSSSQPTPGIAPVTLSPSQGPRSTHSPSQVSSRSPTASPSTSPSELSSASPTSAPQTTDSCGPSCISIYEESLDPAWTAEYSFKCDYNLSYQEDAAVGSTSIRLSYTRYGALYLKYSSGLNTSGLQFLQFWMKGEEAGYKIRVKVDGKRHAVETNATWQLVEISLAEFSNPKMITKIYFQNDSSKNRVVFIDGVRLV